MAQRVGVRFQRAGTIYFFDPCGLNCRAGEPVVVETAHGTALGWVAVAPEDVQSSEAALKPVLRAAAPEDLERRLENCNKEQAALSLAKQRAVEAGLSMKFLTAESNLEASLMTIHFRSESRVDFRRLLRDLSAELGLKVELRQAGARDEARLLGGLGLCGRPMCCATHLCSLESVSMKMAKEQGLPLNPAKLSGICGRLMCCLAYEVEHYRRARREGTAAPEQAAAVAEGMATEAEATPVEEEESGVEPKNSDQ